MDPIKVTQARYYPHDDEVWQPGPEEGVLTLVDDGAISELQLDRIYVDTDCVEIGSITMSARGPDQEDAYGYEIDLDHRAARRLADALTTAAHAIEPTTRARDDNDG